MVMSLSCLPGKLHPSVYLNSSDHVSLLPTQSQALETCSFWKWSSVKIIVTQNNSLIQCHVSSPCLLISVYISVLFIPMIIMCANKFYQYQDLIIINNNNKGLFCNRETCENKRPTDGLNQLLISWSKPPGHVTE